MVNKKNATVEGAKAVVEADKNMVKDRIGESVDLNKCPVCTAHTDCFGNIEGKCTALNCTICGGHGCTFYKPLEVSMAEDKAAYKKLFENQRYDLIHKYGKQLSALGAMDDDVEDEGIDFEAYAEADYQKQLAEMGEDVDGVNGAVEIGEEYKEPQP